jgi:hypothetical protein
MHPYVQLKAVVYDFGAATVGCGYNVPTGLQDNMKSMDKLPVVPLLWRCEND